MLKNALMFAGAAFLLVLMAPSYLPYLNQGREVAAQARAPSITPISAGVEPAQPPVKDAFREKSIPADGRGQYSVDVLVEGASVPMLIDTGASFVSISASVAARIGATPPPGAPRWKMTTANGVAYASPVRLKHVDLGSIYLSDVDAIVADPSAGEVNLLGASFLKRLNSVEQRDGLLILRQ